jgi:3-oxoadipate enol-lactonase
VTATGTGPPPVALAHDDVGPRDGAPVVLLHSIGTDRTVWADHVAGLSEDGHRVLVPDLRGHGRSPVPAGPYAIQDLAADVLALLDRHDLPTADVAGVSLGGAVGLWLARHRPDRVRRLVACCTAAHFGGRDTWGPRIAAARATGLEPLADPTVERWFTAPYRERHPERVARIRARFLASPAEGYAAAGEALADLDLRDELHRIAAPTLVIGGVHDVATPVDVAARPMAAAIPGARLALVGAAHLAPYERPDLVGPPLRSHLRA